MRTCRRKVFLSLPLIAMVLAAPVNAATQKLPSTPDGHPDLQGIWTGGTLTPYERPPQHADKTHLTNEETAAQQPEATKRFWAAGHRPDDVGRDNDAFIDDDLKLLANGQTSLVVLPLDGKYPLRPEAEQRRDFNLKSLDNFETMSQWDRCITREPTALFAVNYNNAYQIVQTGTHVMIMAEMIHDARVIALSGSHPDARVKTWGGDSRGRWEGATLVVDTTNFGTAGWLTTGQNAGRLRGVPVSDKLHIVERFTRVDANTLNYEVTVDDPSSFTAPFKLMYPLHREDDYRIYEYACHEGNTAIELMLRGARVQEAQKIAK